MSDLLCISCVSNKADSELIPFGKCISCFNKDLGWNSIKSKLPIYGVRILAVLSNGNITTLTYNYKTISNYTIVAWMNVPKYKMQEGDYDEFCN